jgi:adenylate kinase family enzyme
MTLGRHDGQRSGSPPTRILIIGGEASGKTTLARQLAALLAVPLHELDHVAWQSAADPGKDLGEVFHPDYQASEAVVPRPLPERLALIRRIARQRAWIAEGVFLWWTEELFDAAELIIWLDHVRFPTVVARVLARHARSARREATIRSGHEKFTRLRDYWNAIRRLVSVVVRVARFHFGRVPTEVGHDDFGAITRRAMQSAARGRYGQKLVHVRSRQQLRTLLSDLTAASAAVHRTRTNAAHGRSA